VVLTSLKNMKVNWDYDIPNIWKNNPNVPNHQPAIFPALHYSLTLMKVAALNCSGHNWVPLMDYRFSFVHQKWPGGNPHVLSELCNLIRKV